MAGPSRSLVRSRGNQSSWTIKREEIRANIRAEDVTRAGRLIGTAARSSFHGCSRCILFTSWPDRSRANS